MEADASKAGGSPGSSPHAPSKPSKVAILYRKGHPQEELFVEALTARLTAGGLTVFVDRETQPGVQWAGEILKQIRDSDVAIPLLSAESVASEIFAAEVEIAHEYGLLHAGRPQIVPVRVSFHDPLPEPLNSMLDTIPPLSWELGSDAADVLGKIVHRIQEHPVPAAAAVPAGPFRMIRKPAPVPPPPAGHKPMAPAAVEPIGGAVPIDSPFYIVRPADLDLRRALTSHDSVVLIKGARQIGKTSLLARGLKFAREGHSQVAMTDFQKFNSSNLSSVANLHLSLAESLAEQLDLPVLPSEVWDERRGPNVNFERYIRREVLSRINGHLVWGLDEVDRLFGYPYASEVFGLFRSWHNERALDPSGPWSRLTLVIAYATEAHLFITDINQSPFNIGTRISLEDFYPNQVAELNERYGSPLKGKPELDRFVHLLGGHPFLVRLGLHELSRHKTALNIFEERAPRDDGIYGEHLRRILVLLARDPALTEMVKGVLRGQPSLTPDGFYRLRSAGVMKGTSQNDVRPRCQLYATYLGRHLLEPGWIPQV